MGNLDLIDWTMETAKELRTPNDPVMAAPVTGSEAILRSDDWLLMPGPGTGTATEQPATEPLAVQASDEPPAYAFDEPSVAASEPPAPQPALPTPPADVHAALLQAIVDPGIYTSKADRHRAIDLRWILRDIAANRLKASPIRQLDLQILIDMKLVELRGGVPYLTETGQAATV